MNIKHKGHKAVATIDFIKYDPDKFLTLIGVYNSSFLLLASFEN